MRALLDANILITYITERDDSYANECKELVKLCAGGAVEGYMAFHALSIIWYVISRAKDRDTARAWLDNLCQVLLVASASHDQVQDAIANKDFKDFEDCLVDQCARNVAADYIITANIRDFSSSSTAVITPTEFLSLAKASENV